MHGESAAVSVSLAVVTLRVAVEHGGQLGAGGDVSFWKAWVRWISTVRGVM